MKTVEDFFRDWVGTRPNLKLEFHEAGIEAMAFAEAYKKHCRMDMAMLPTESQLDEIAFRKYGNDPDGLIKFNLIKRMAFVEGCEFMLRLLNVGNSEANVCPKCGYPKFKKHHEDFERCNGCDWTSK